jgi:hypothetical protein
MTSINDGGPAFPVPPIHTGSNTFIPGTNGMSLRDWSAHQNGVGIDDMRLAAGLPPFVDEPDATPEVHPRLMRFDDTPEQGLRAWWHAVPLDERARLAAKVRYAYADAMIAERAKETP